MSDAWTRRLLSLNTEIVEADASLTVALRKFFACSNTGEGAAKVTRQIASDVARLALLRRLRDHHLQTVRASASRPGPGPTA